MSAAPASSPVAVDILGLPLHPGDRVALVVVGVDHEEIELAFGVVDRFEDGLVWWVERVGTVRHAWHASMPDALKKVARHAGEESA